MVNDVQGPILESVERMKRNITLVFWLNIYSVEMGIHHYT